MGVLVRRTREGGCPSSHPAAPYMSSHGMYFLYGIEMRAGRLLQVLMLLQEHGRLSARRLAEEVQVSVRTIHRDVEELSASGVPVVAERGATGGFALLEGWRTRLTGLTPIEATVMSSLP